MTTSNSTFEARRIDPPFGCILPPIAGVMLNRRQLLTAVAGGLLGSLVVPRRGAAQQQPGLVPLNDRLLLMTSGGTNVLLLSTADGLIMVDSGAPDLIDELMRSVRQVSGRITTVFNTHYHAQNTGANEVLRRSGATILAHENTRL